MDDKLLSYKRDNRIIILQGQLDYFRGQAVRLEKERENYITENKKLKQRLNALRDDKLYFETFVIETRQENADLKRVIKEMEEKGNRNIMEFVEKHHKENKDYITRSRITSANPLDRPSNKPGYAKPWLVTNPWKPTMIRATDEKKQ